MIFPVIRQYRKIIKSYEIKKFVQSKNAYALVVDFIFKNDSQLIIKDYLFLDESRKYSYHFQDKQGNLIFRYDNAPHWKTVSTFPHHKHISDNIIESKMITMEELFEEISKLIASKTLSFQYFL